MAKNVFKILIVFIIGIVGGIFADQILWPYFIERPLFLKYRLDQAPIYITEEKKIFIQENTALQDAVKKVKEVVVGIRTETNKEVLEGSGLIVTSDGLVVTLSSLLPEGAETALYFNGEVIAAEIIKRENGFVLLNTDKENLPTVDFAKAEEIRLGQRIFLTGVIFEESKVGRIVDEGIIRYLSGDIIETSISDEEILIGSSLFNIKGEVIGLRSFDEDNSIIIPVREIEEFFSS